MPIRFDFKRPDKAEFQKLLMGEIGKEVKKAIPTLVTKMVAPIQRIIKKEFIEHSSTYRSMLSPNSELAGSLGVVDMPGDAEKIIDYIISTVKVEPTNRVKVSDKEVSAGVRVTILGGTGSLTGSILNVPVLQPYIKYRTEIGETIPWLEWLLTAGDGVVIADYYVDYGSYPRSRTGLAIMIRAENYKYRIPAQHSGTPRDNFITRTLDRPTLIDSVGQVVEKTIEKYFKES